MSSIARSIAKWVPGVRRLYLKRHYRRYLNELRIQAPIGNGKKILIINHHFDQDIDALLRGCSDQFQFLVVDCMPFFNEALLYFHTDEERDGIIPYNLLRPEIITGYRAACRGLFYDLQKIFPFEAIIMPSDSFWWIREFLEVAHEHGVRRIVLDKEGTISPYSFKVHSTQIKEKFPFISDNLLVWSERQKQFWIKAGAPEDCIRIVGQPRSDFFFQPNRWLTKQQLEVEGFARHLLYFTFDIDAYINVFPAEEILREGYSWVGLRNEINEKLVAFAQRHPEVCITVKVHPQQADIDFMRQWVMQWGLTNLRLAEGAGISNQLIVNADLILGFQTTALIEAMLTDKPVFYTAWTETECKLREELIPLHESAGLNWLRSPEDLRRDLELWAAREWVGGDLAQRKVFTDAWLFADGKVCSRLSQNLAEIVAQD